MLLFADADFLQCLIQFGVFGFFLLISFISWVLKQVGSGSGQAIVRRLQSRGEFDATIDDRLDDEPYAAEVIDAKQVTPADSRITSTLSTTDLADHAAQLGHLDDRPAEKGIHDHFDDQVGRLGDSSDAIHEDPDAEKLPDVAVTTGEIIDIFRHPERIREAIVLNEILSRPEDRWE